MALIPVHFEYRTGLRRQVILNARLSGSWTGAGFHSDQWTTVAMTPFTADDGCPAFRATVQLDDSQIGRSFQWGVAVDTPAAPNHWGIPTEAGGQSGSERNRTFTLDRPGQSERYDLTTCRRLGANKLFVEGRDAPAIRFAVWAPNAQAVGLVRGEPVGGYIDTNGGGVTATIPMRRVAGGIWETEVAADPSLGSFAGYDHTPYMFRITKDDGSIAYRTDLYSRCQIGTGDVDPERGGHWDGTRQDLDGTKSCSVVIDPEQVASVFREVECQRQSRSWPETQVGQ
ncbi:MAG: hypothetical protein HC834_06300 [Rhodospirillales bacterium]|nr:hypothetical protein [Rhodospirillales bacterium]